MIDEIIEEIEQLEQYLQHKGKYDNAVTQSFYYIKEGIKNFRFDLNAVTKLNDQQSNKTQLEYIAENHSVRLGENEIHLTPAENRLIGYLWDNRGRFCSRKEILSDVWGKDVSGTFLTTIISRLRMKIEPDNTHPQYIITLGRTGYTLFA